MCDDDKKKYGIRLLKYEEEERRTRTTQEQAEKRRKTQKLNEQLKSVDLDFEESCNGHHRVTFEERTT